MATITIRTDPAVDEALDALAREGKSRSEVVREAILLAYREQRHARLRAEAEALRNDPADVAASRALTAEMDSLRAW
ncbi:MAG: ribbon-helix-helix protein, CopG family [Actinobacteria bacterium]|nr:ribbon-helix-helix protein, CopG family [Actinomycetota bacterium]NIU71012.1 ribbon-helix-helix protein, CopG family [Actinomycetota bacterium]NIW32958.1 ribbon-helix-helix protein, CopG family [Actinomycetota bacterium]NIX25106.1 ribbon-helix-helix protein, CopG family [Actinomycetota bacterium]